MSEDDKAAQPTEQQADQSQSTSVDNAGVKSHQHDGGDAAAQTPPPPPQEHGNQQPAGQDAGQTGEGTGAKAGEYS